MTHKMKFAEDFLDFDPDEAEAEYRTALPSAEELAEMVSEAEVEAAREAGGLIETKLTLTLTFDVCITAISDKQCQAFIDSLHRADLATIIEGAIWEEAGSEILLDHLSIIRLTPTGRSVEEKPEQAGSKNRNRGL